MTTPQLLCDSMLGELARWLRLMGFDTIFMPDAPDIDIVRRARYDGRIVLTQDRPLAAHPAVQAIIIESDALDAQLEQVRVTVGLPEGQPRCAMCNTTLESLSRSDAKGRVPPYVFRTVTTYSLCPGCHRIYWKGTHWESIEARLPGQGD
ncbi:MAG: Mut7-C RNAse domain-containing protein [Anaerolineae bacterium]